MHKNKTEHFTGARNKLSINNYICIFIFIYLFIYCNCDVTRCHWLFYVYTKYEIGYY